VAKVATPLSTVRNCLTVPSKKKVTENVGYFTDL